ncbi:DUF1700 domain-containing protein [Amycolatopsis australiensis]|uniref:Uncharacterized membrane protein n=1 Tax=Amycolatopsis australiensis TaxID=546364 RepID=A0A1K1T4J1_9PSEU|nr:hypothetical protein [Amycolatopsis australiensis]SFW91507.1 Uncharacterized membrane protein [Amycolatopsis australiensis]
MSDKPTAVRVYLARVRTALADLPASEIEEILDDVRPHLAELEAELGEGARVEALIERLGTPESYAAELRASGGYPPAAEGATQVLPAKTAPSLVKPRIAFWGLLVCAVALALFAFGAAVNLDPGDLLGAVLFLPVFLVSLFFLLSGGTEPVLALPEVGWLRRTLAKGREQEDSGKALSYLASLKPAWWVVCALVLVAFGLLLMLRSRSAVLLLPFLLVAGGAAVWAGPRLRRDRRLLWVAVPVSAFVIGGMLGGFAAAVDLISHRNSYANMPSYYQSSDRYGNDQLTYGGREIENVYAFDGEGKPLTEVYLYDEEGRPITLTRYGCERSSGTKEKIGADNRFPRPRIEQGVTDDQGNYNGYNGYRSACREDASVPFSAAIPKVTAPPTSPTAPTSSTAPATPTPTR